MVKPTHTFIVPVITAGKGLTVTVVVTKHPVGKVYDITEVPPDTPVTTPVPATTVATAGVALLHVPPAVASASVVVEAWHTVVVPVMTAGNGLTVTANGLEAMLVPQPLVAVTVTFPLAETAVKSTVILFRFWGPGYVTASAGAKVQL